jgi:purine-nucleoside phosphorylase
MNSNIINLEMLNQGWQDINNFFSKAKPFAVLVLGSGWGDVVSAFNIKDEMSYEKIRGFGKGGVIGHANKLSLAEIDGREIFIFQGRRHFYEGEGITPVVAPAYFTRQSGASIMFLSNAAGGISYKPGQLMIVNDHINLQGINCLAGPHREEFGPRFTDQTEVYKKELCATIEKVGKKVDVELVSGVYLGLSGPSYETGAEIRFAKTIGADAVGMSTVPEAMLANSMGIKVAAISCITNYSTGISKHPLGHQEVVDTLNSVMPKLRKLIPEIVRAF